VRPGAWTPEQAERHLRSLELFGMRFGLDRMRRMMTALGSPQRSFRSIHVVGTNGKTSTTRMITAILREHGLHAGCYLSPHLISYPERVRVDDEHIDPHAFAAAIARAAWAAERVNRTLAEDDRVTQFELLTAAAFWELARREVDVAVIEAGLGGRFDATNVIDSQIAVLTNVGLEHTRWLGPTVEDIAAEKLAVVRDGATLAIGRPIDPSALAVARSVAAEREATIVQAAPPSPDAPTAASGAFQQANFALARTAAEACLRSSGIAPRMQAIRAAAASTIVPGRLQQVSRDPLVLIDGAHNPDAVQALLGSLDPLIGERPLGLVLGVLDDKDATGMLTALLARSERAWFTAPPSSRALSPAALQSLARQLGFERASCEPSPVRALAAARSWALAEHRDRAVLATGSVYMVGDLLAHASELGLDGGREHDIASAGVAGDAQGRAEK
jgi:dihydrofolate synthase / folylpolyglutamate synthase